jgi:hypothetical protein
MNFLEADISKSDKEFADAWQKDKDAFLKAQAAQAAAAAKAQAGTGGGGGSVGSTVIPPNMIAIEQNPDVPGTYRKFVYRMDAQGNTQKK